MACPPLPPPWPGDALSLLPLDGRDAVLRHLPRPVRDSLRPLGIVPAAPQPACRLGWGLLAWRGA